MFFTPNSYHQNFRTFDMSRHLIPVCNARVMLILWSPSLLPGHRRNRWIGSATRNSTPGSVPGRSDQRRAAPVARRGQQLRTANEITHGERRFRRAKTSTWQAAVTIVLLGKYQEQA